MAAGVPIKLVLLPLVLLAETKPQQDSNKTDAKLDISHLMSDAEEVDIPVSHTQVRSTVRVGNLAGQRNLSLHLDGRLRRGWTDYSRDRQELTRLYVSYGGETDRLVLRIGRQPVLSVYGARVDGAVAALRLAEGTRLAVFGGLLPHPLDGSVDIRFRTAGLGYEARSRARSHGGAVVCQWFGPEIDRLYVSERGRLQLSESLAMVGLLVVDFLAPRGIMDDLRPQHRDDENSQGGVDISNAQLRFVFRQRKEIGGSFSAIHSHTLIPNKWWYDWTRRQRERRGFVENDWIPVGTRRSSLRLKVHAGIASFITSYVVLRADRRHNGQQNGSELRPGIKVNVSDRGFIDIAYSHHNYYGRQNNRVDSAAAIDIGTHIFVDMSLSAMHTLAPELDDGTWLYDVGVATHVLLGGLHEVLNGLSMSLQYQGFIEPGVTLHVVFARLGYRFRTGLSS